VAGATMRLTGVEGLERNLAALGRKIGGKISRAALRVGAKTILAEAKRRAPVADKGLIPPSLKVRARKRSRKNKGTVNIIVATAKGWFKGKEFYAAFVEFGHFAGSRKLGASRTWVPPRPFVGPAYEAKKLVAISQIIRELRRGIESEAGKP